VGEKGRAEQIVHGYVEEALDLRGVQVHGEDAVGSGLGDEVGDELGGDGVAAFGLAVLPGIAKVRDNGGDASGAGAAHGVDHDQKFHQVVVDGLAGGLDYENIRASDGFPETEGYLAVGKGGNRAVAELAA